MKKLGLLFFVVVFTLACKNDDDSRITGDAAIILSLTESWDKELFNNNNLNTTIYTNANGEELIVNRLRYLVSQVILTHTSTGENFTLIPYRLRDISQTDVNEGENSINIPTGNYSLSFVYGFNEADNSDGAYEDLNIASWNWPQMLGGGYHFMQLDGSYNVNVEPAPFNFHNGTAKVSDGVFEQNFVEFSFSGIEITKETTTINLNMDVSEWFKNPHTWNLNELDTQLMPNYNAQKLMQENAASVFSVKVE